MTKRWLIMAGLIFALTTSGCTPDESDEGPLERAGREADEALAEARIKAEEAAKVAREKAKIAAEVARQKVNEAAGAVEDATD